MANPQFTYSSNNESVATVSTNGLVTGVSKGNATITISYINSAGNSLTDTCAVTVKVNTQSIAFPSQSVTLSRGSSNPTKQLSVTFNPTNTDAKGISWTSADTSVATVNGSGVVTGLKAGTSTITATVNNNVGLANPSATCLVEVKQLVTDLDISQASNDTTITGNAEQLAFTRVASPSTANNTNVTWSVNDGLSIVSQNYNSCVVKGAKVTNSAKLTATANDGSGVSETKTIVVQQGKVTSFTLSKKSGQVYTTKPGSVSGSYSCHGSTIVLKTNISHNIIGTPSYTYKWTLKSGSGATVTGNGSECTVVFPGTAASYERSFTIQCVVTESLTNTSHTATFDATIPVGSSGNKPDPTDTPTPGGSSGSTPSGSQGSSSGSTSGPTSGSTSGPTTSPT